MKEQMEEEKAVIDRERAVAEGRDAEAKEEEVCSLLCCHCCASPAPSHASIKQLKIGTLKLLTQCHTFGEAIIIRMSCAWVGVQSIVLYKARVASSG